MTKAQTMKLLAVMKGAFPKHPVADGTIEAYHLGLGDLPYHAAQNAVLQMLRTHEWFPTISQIRDIAIHSELGLPTTEQVFGQFARGNFQVHPLAKEALQQLGGQWSYSHSNMPQAWRKEYRKAYEDLCDSAVIGYTPKQLGDGSKE